MHTILGLDTGGTYTDGVIVRSGSREILCKTKAPTTKNDLRIGIENCIKGLDETLLREISLVCLSTTIATNAIVEAHGCQEGLILIGKAPSGKIPTERYKIVKGRCDIYGRILDPVDPEEIDQTIKFFGGRVDALAVSGYASVRNPQLEIYVKRRIRETLAIPVACAHELTSSLGFHNRTVTAVLNAKLIPMICDLIDSVGQALKNNGIAAPLMIVKGDGTLMTDGQARDKPIETILSGPAASVIGGKFLSGEADAIVLDMGGTTTDLANIVGGTVKIRDEGAKVGKWFTHIKAAEVYTVGMGGNSRIYTDSFRKVFIGPQWSMPLCVAGNRYPSLYDELQRICEDESRAFLNFRQNEAEAYLFNRKYDLLRYTEDERILIEAVRDRPHTLHTLLEIVGMDSMPARLDKLVREGAVMRISVTPTDILHVCGEYGDWDSHTARLGIRILSEQLGKSVEEVVLDVRRSIIGMIRDACIQGAFYFDSQKFEIPSDEAADYFVNRVCRGEGSDILGGSLRLKKKIVAIGAPAKAWMQGVGEELGTHVMVPENAEVANAVGAAVGEQIENSEILIRPDPITKKFTAFTRISRKSFASLEDATAYAEETGKTQIGAYFAGTPHVTEVEIEDFHDENCLDNTRNFVERRVRVTATAKFV